MIERIAEWHRSDSKLEIHEYLGMTKDEYKLHILIPLGILLYANSNENCEYYEF